MIFTYQDLAKGTVNAISEDGGAWMEIPSTFDSEKDRGAIYREIRRSWGLYLDIEWVHIMDVRSHNKLNEAIAFKNKYDEG